MCHKGHEKHATDPSVLPRLNSFKLFSQCLLTLALTQLRTSGVYLDNIENETSFNKRVHEKIEALAWRKAGRTHRGRVPIVKNELGGSATQQELTGGGHNGMNRGTGGGVNTPPPPHTHLSIPTLDRGANDQANRQQSRKGNGHRHFTKSNGHKDRRLRSVWFTHTVVVIR